MLASLASRLINTALTGATYDVDGGQQLSIFLTLESQITHVFVRPMRVKTSELETVLGDRVGQSPRFSAAPSGFRLVFRHSGTSPRVSYCASTQVSDPTSLTDTFEKKSRSGLPSAVPRWSVEIRRGPAFL